MIESKEIIEVGGIEEVNFNHESHDTLDLMEDLSMCKNLTRFENKIDEYLSKGYEFSHEWYDGCEKYKCDSISSFIGSQLFEFPEGILGRIISRGWLKSNDKNFISGLIWSIPEDNLEFVCSLLMTFFDKDVIINYKEHKTGFDIIQCILRPYNAKINLEKLNEMNKKTFWYSRSIEKVDSRKVDIVLEKFLSYLISNNFVFNDIESTIAQCEKLGLVLCYEKINKTIKYNKYDKY